MPKKDDFTKETQRRFDIFWEQASAEKKRPSDTALGKVRLQAIEDLLEKIIEENSPKNAADIGVGEGFLLKKLTSIGLETHALDVASYPLSSLQGLVSSTFQAALPYLDFLDDEKYDLVLCLDLIAEIPSHLHRLALSELFRLMAKKGRGLISTPLDIHSADAYESFLALVETEFEIEESVLRFDRLYFALLGFFSFPEKITKAKKDRPYLHKSLKKRRGISKLLFKCLAHPFSSPLLIILYGFFKLPHSFFKKSQKTIRLLNSFTEILFGRFGLTHALLLVKRKKLF